MVSPVLVQHFENPIFGKIKVLKYNGQIMFGRSSLFKALGIEDLDKFNVAVKYCCPRVEATYPDDNNDRKIFFEMLRVVPIEELTKFINYSKHKMKFEFLQWVMESVVPEISSYTELLENIQELKAKIAEQTCQISDMNRAYSFGRIVSYSRDSVSIEMAVAILNEYEAEISVAELVTWMLENEWFKLEGTSLTPTEVAYRSRWLQTTSDKRRSGKYVHTVPEEGLMKLLDQFCFGWKNFTQYKEEL